jgi:hypothetical protein
VQDASFCFPLPSRTACSAADTALDLNDGANMVLLSDACLACFFALDPANNNPDDNPGVWGPCTAAGAPAPSPAKEHSPPPAPPRKDTAPSCVTSAEFTARAAEVTAECCDEPSESCDDGYPVTCNAGCSAVLVPMVAGCKAGFLSSGPFKALADTLDEAAATCAPPPPPCASFDDLQARSLAAEQACCPDGAACAGDDLPTTCTAGACAAALTTMQAACNPFLVHHAAS